MDPHVVLLGAGFGGLYAARNLNGLPIRVTVIDRRNHHLFQPLLYQVATGSLSPGDIASPLRWVLRRQKNTKVLMAEVTGIDVATRRVEIGEQSIEYDILIAACGARHHYFGHNEWEEIAPGLKTLDDALAIRRKILLAFERANPDPWLRLRMLRWSGDVTMLPTDATRARLGALVNAAKRAGPPSAYQGPLSPRRRRAKPA